MHQIYLRVRCQLLIGLIRLSGKMEAIFVAAIAAVGGILAALVQRGRKENKDDHNIVANLLIGVKDDIIHLHEKIDHVDDQVDKVDDKIDMHIQWHRKQNK